MDLTVRQHIEQLEDRLKELSFRIMNENDKNVRNVLEAEIRAAGLALSHYRAALEIELSLKRDKQ
jgi:hypothetical protein